MTMLRAVYDKVHKPTLWKVSAFLLFILIAEIALTCLIPTWRDYFYKVLQQFNRGEFWPALWWGLALMTGLGAVQGVKTWARQKFSFTIRKAASKVFLKKWVYSKRTNPNYSIALTDTIKNSTDLLFDVACEIFISFAIVVVLIANSWHQPEIIISALVYTLAVSGLAYLFNTPLIKSDAELQKTEGAYRTAIGDIANDRGDFSAKEKWEALSRAFSYYINVLMGFTLFSRVKGSLATLVPYVLLFDAYFDKQIDLGGFMAGVSSFELIVINTTILVVVYPQITKAIASYKIAKEFYNEIQN
jgi:ABC-type uncharacterized transport system fused permease/ATPase subunit